MEDAGSELTILLPVRQEEHHSDKMTNLFRHLEQQQRQLGIDSYGISETTLEEVRYACTAAT